jgi:hypothetical protein
VVQEINRIKASEAKHGIFGGGKVSRNNTSMINDMKYSYDSHLYIYISVV